MAECFCGCGRKVRFANKALSEYGARTQQMLAALKTDYVKLDGDGMPDESAVQNLIDNGVRLEEMFRGMVHGTLRPPPRSEGEQLSSYYHRWLETAATVLAMMRQQADAESS